MGRHKLSLYTFMERKQTEVKYIQKRMPTDCHVHEAVILILKTTGGLSQQMKDQFGKINK